MQIQIQRGREGREVQLVAVTLLLLGGVVVQCWKTAALVLTRVPCYPATAILQQTSVDATRAP